MLQRGRKSRFSIVPAEPMPRIEPSASLRGLDRRMFQEIVNACRPDHFTDSDRFLLEAYCTAAAMARLAAPKAARGDELLLNVYVRTVKLQAMLATKLRLTPHARLSAKSLGRHSPSVGRPPWG